MSPGGLQNGFSKVPSEQGWHGIADLPGTVLAVSLEYEGIGKGLNACPFANSEAPMFDRMCEAASCEAIEPGRQGD